MDATNFNVLIRALECQLDTSSKANLLNIASQLALNYSSLIELYFHSA